MSVHLVNSGPVFGWCNVQRIGGDYVCNLCTVFNHWYLEHILRKCPMRMLLKLTKNKLILVRVISWCLRQQVISRNNVDNHFVNQCRQPYLQYIPRNMHTVFALLCFVVVIHWLIFPYPSGLLHWHCGNLTIAPVPAKQPWWIWINTSCEFIMNDCTTTTKQSTTKPSAYFLGYTVSFLRRSCNSKESCLDTII